MQAQSTIQCDLLVVGGGINGAGIARDAAGRGLSVVLCEQDDLASHTSSASTKLIHGGLRYLEHYEFALVKKALREREVLMRAAPHLIRPLQFVLPHDDAQRPAWMIRAGLFLYDHLAGRDFLPGSGRVDLRSHPAGAPLHAKFADGFVYSDGWVDDARLVVANALDAAQRGARILTRTRCAEAVRDGDVWQAKLVGVGDGSVQGVRARCLVNAAGPWAGSFVGQIGNAGPARVLRLVKGSHIVVPRLFEHGFAYLLQHSDRRVVFAIPYQRHFTLIGTTDVDYLGDPGDVSIDAAEVRYLCALCNRYFQQPVAPSDVVWSYSGVRPLVEDAGRDAAAVTRDYRFEVDGNGPVLLSVFGGKITTYRRLAEEALDRLRRWLPDSGSAWTRSAVLPGGDLPAAASAMGAATGLDAYVADLVKRFAWLPEPLLERYAHAYGTRIEILLSGRRCAADLGAAILPDLYEVEAQYWMQHEWALTAHDMLWRRSKLGLHAGEGAAAVLQSWIDGRNAP